MRTGMDFLKAAAAEAGITLGDTINGQVFADLGLPMVVACTGCEMTMALPSCLVDDNNYVWCDMCAPLDDDEITAEDLAEYQGRYK